MDDDDEPHGPDHPLRPATRAIRAGRGSQGASLAPALWGSTVWESAGLGDAHTRASARRDRGYYSRYGNPTVGAFEDAIADLEGAEAALAFASGIGAVATTVLALCSSGDHVVAQRQLYAGTLAFLLGPCARFGIETTVVDGTAPGAFSSAVQPGRTMLVIAETPSNPLLELVDLDEFGAITGPFTLVDSTFATPMGQQPLAHGVDLVLHSATKGIGGHNDATLGVVAGDADLLDDIWAYSVLHGAAASPFDALNGLRGIRTLAVRTAQQSATAMTLATWLCDRPEVDAVHYPGLPSHPQHVLAERQMQRFGSVLSFEIRGGRPQVAEFLDRVRLCRIATSLGGPETLVCHPATTTQVGMRPEDLAATGVTDGLVRISVGLEDPDDLIGDLEQALTPRS